MANDRNDYEKLLTAKFQVQLAGLEDLHTEMLSHAMARETRHAEIVKVSDNINFAKQTKIEFMNEEIKNLKKVIRKLKKEAKK